MQRWLRWSRGLHGDYGTVGIKHYFGVAPTPSADKRYVRYAHAITLTP